MNKQRNTNAQYQNRNRLLLLGAVALLILAALLLYLNGRAPSNITSYRKKLALLEPSVLAAETGKSPAGGQAGQAIFLSLCDTTERASVFCGTGPDLRSAWKSVSKQTEDFLSSSNYDPVWVKADVVYSSQRMDAEELGEAVRNSRDFFFRYGIAFDSQYETALLEAELNSAWIYDYEADGLNLKLLNRYLSKAGREPMESLPGAFLLFQCLGWLCDENNSVYPLYGSGLEYGRRMVEQVDRDYAAWLTENAADFLARQVKEDGSFIYGLFPFFDQEIENYNILRHAGTIWSMLCQYRVSQDDALVEPIQRAIDYMRSMVVYQDENTAYLYEEKSDEIKLGGCGIGVLALTEYMDVFQNQDYAALCEQLGNGILALMNEETGGYFHVLNRDFSPKEEYRTVYYDGEATFALCRLYSVTGNERWLTAAQKAADHFIAEDYTQYMDHWVAYAMNELTKYVDDPAYYSFGLRNAQVNLDKIASYETAYQTNLELLMATFELYDRALEKGIPVDGFDLEAFLNTVSIRVSRQLNGYLYPEYAMYMEHPQKILNTFMVRQDYCRVRIDDVQHNIGGFYMYLKNYDKLVACGLPDVGEIETR